MGIRLQAVRDFVIGNRQVLSDQIERRLGWQLPFVTGATGFIGSHVALLPACEGCGSRFKALDCAGAGYRKARYRVVSGRHSQFDQVRSVMVGCEAVFHVAADYRLWGQESRRNIRNERGRDDKCIAGSASHRAERVITPAALGSGVGT